MELNLKDKIIVVSNGAKDIGEGIVKVLANEGAIPVIIGRNESDNLKIVEAVKSSGGKCFQIVAELTKPDECESAIKKIIKEFGAIHSLVNNADVNDGIGLEHTNYEAFTALLHKNLIHYYLLAHYALPELKKTKGSIINITAKTAETKQSNNTSAYSVVNGGINALTREWAVELLKYSIRVNAVVVERLTSPQEIANTVAFLLSEKSSHTTGQLIHVENFVSSNPVSINV
jgi:L-fucose dehydrogenase